MTITVELGNPTPHERLGGPGASLVPLDLSGPAVSYLRIPQGITDDGLTLYGHPEEHDDSLFPAELADALAAVGDGAGKTMTRRILIEGWLNQGKGLPDHEAFVAVAHPGGFWREVAAFGAVPSWVAVPNHAGLEALLADFYGCPAGAPQDVEDTHWTYHGVTLPPGARPGVGPAGVIEALHLNSGRDMQAIEMGGFGYLGTTGIASATSATSLTGGTETGVSHSADDCKGQIIYAGPNASGTGSVVYGLITTNTSGTTPVYTVDRWYDPANPGGTAGTTPNATAKYQVVNGSISSPFVGISANAVAVGATDTTLPGEITTAGGGLIRKISPIGHTAAAATWTATPVFTANGTDTLPVTIAKAGLSQSLLSGFQNVYQTLVSPTATLSASGDQLTLTWTFTMT